jgi:hypothetical protein
MRENRDFKEFWEKEDKLFMEQNGLSPKQFAEEQENVFNEMKDTAKRLGISYAQANNLLIEKDLAKMRDILKISTKNGLRSTAEMNKVLKIKTPDTEQGIN